MTCQTCVSMREMHLPTCRQELAALAYRDCDSDRGDLMQFIDDRLSDDNHPRGHWAQLAHVRREHLEFHRINRDSCSTIDELRAEQKDRASR